MARLADDGAGTWASAGTGWRGGAGRGRGAGREDGHRRARLQARAPAAMPPERGRRAGAGRGGQQNSGRVLYAGCGGPPRRARPAAWRPEWRRLGGARSASLRFSSSASRPGTAPHLTLRSSAGMRLTSAKFRRALGALLIAQGGPFDHATVKGGLSRPPTCSRSCATAPATCFFCAVVQRVPVGAFSGFRACCCSAVSSLQERLGVRCALRGLV